jgi:hypothetical protein
MLELIDVEHSFHLGQQACDWAEVAACDSDDGCDDIRPVLLKKGLHLRSRESPEFVHEADAAEWARNLTTVIRAGSSGGALAVCVGWLQ